MSEAIERGGAALDLHAAEVQAADRVARTWAAGECGPIVLGSEAHKRAFCRMLLDTHNPYRPAIVDWPALEPEARDRLVALIRAAARPPVPRKKTRTPKASKRRRLDDKKRHGTIKSLRARPTRE